MDVYCGIDWAEDHHDIALVDRDGQLLARRRISDDAAGLAGLLALLAEHGDSGDEQLDNLTASDVSSRHGRMRGRRKPALKGS